MMWAIKHKSGRVLFTTSDEFIADNRRDMGWIVEEVKMTSREQFELWIESEHGYYGEDLKFEHDRNCYSMYGIHLAWLAWQASREAIGVDHPACWRTYYPDTDDEIFRAHSESNESCAKRIASEIGGYVVPVYHGKPVHVEVKK